MPSTVTSSVTMVFDSSTVITPSLPTFFIASAMMLPMVASLLAEMVPTCAIISPEISLESFFTSPIATSTAFSMPRFSAMGLAPAATDFPPHLGAHVLERVLQLDFLGHRHAVLGDARTAEFLLQNHVPALGAQRYL